MAILKLEMGIFDNAEDVSPGICAIGCVLMLCCAPRIVGAEIPQISLRIAAEIVAPAVVFVFDLNHNFGSSGVAPFSPEPGVSQTQMPGKITRSQRPASL
ncbi:hypothetical protein IQ238_14145 [Pleurocapsales cyanobacterium LEGE 06147]|nr:hypothetical protein [Pleurocapsales cyanobacterium LEGE 06147]